MTMAILSVISLFLMWSSKSVNPVKTSMSILVVGMSSFVLMGISTGSTWISILMVMLFMGGIILMFMILSSILPNEKSMKISNPFSMLVAVTLICLAPSWAGSGDLSGESYKSFLSSSNSFWVMMAILLTYFISSMSVISAEQTPMRTLYCCWNLTL